VAQLGSVRRRRAFTMKAPNYKFVGIVLLSGVLLVAILFQIFGSGLVSALPSVPPHSEITAQGYTVEVLARSGIVFHLLGILPLLGVALLGVACLLRSRRHETNA
jgi:hypothetical protein